MNIGVRDLDGAAGGTAGEDCFRAIRGDIVHGRLAPRERLRLEALRGRYGASISTLRETLNRLAGEGLVTGLGRRGFAVAPVTRAEFRELAALRALIEEHALEKSFRRGDLEWEGEVVGAHHRLDRVERMMLAGETGRSDLWKQYDKAFHQVLIAACGSAALIQAHSGIFDRYLRYQIVAMVFRGAVAAEEHRALRQCALDRDAAGARAILRRHIDACVEHTVGTGALDDGPAAEPAAAAETVGHAVWKRLRGDILAGRLAPGQKLRLDALRGDYGASVSTLREVLNRLVTEELVLAEGQRGFEVAPISRAGPGRDRRAAAAAREPRDRRGLPDRLGGMGGAGGRGLSPAGRDGGAYGRGRPQRHRAVEALRLGIPPGADRGLRLAGLDAGARGPLRNG
jgi:DNA-binding GntR family transcriptional regulator